MRLADCVRVTSYFARFTHIRPTLAPIARALHDVAPIRPTGPSSYARLKVFLFGPFVVEDLEFEIAKAHLHRSAGMNLQRECALLAAARIVEIDTKLAV